MTLNEWITIWTNTYKEPFVSSATLDLIGYCLKHFYSFFDKERDMSDIKGYELQKYLLSLNDIGNMQDKCRRYTKELFEYAYRNRIIEYNPMLAIKIKAHEYDNTPPLTLEERLYLLDTLKGKPGELLYITYLCNGARKSEILEGRFSIDLKNDMTFIDGTKTKYSSRYVPLFTKLKDSLGLVPNYKKNYEKYTPDYAYLQFKRHCRKVGLGECCVRSLRSTFSNMCYEVGIREQTIQFWLGHSGRTTLSKYYLDSDHISKCKDGQMLKEIEIVNSIL